MRRATIQRKTKETDISVSIALDGTGKSSIATGVGFLDTDLQNKTSSDLFLVTGNATLGGTLALHCFASCSFAVGDEVVILDATGSLAGSFSNVTLDGFQTGAFTVVYDLAGSRVLLDVTQAVTPAVPEPATWVLMLAGFAAIGGVVRRRSAAAGRGR